MRILKWIALGITMAAVIFGAVQLLLLNEKISRQSKILAQLNLDQHSGMEKLGQYSDKLEQYLHELGQKLEQHSKEFIPILDLGTNVQTMPHTNHRGITAISAYGTAGSLLEGARVYILKNRASPELLFDLYAYNRNYRYVDPPLVTANDTVLVLTSDLTDRSHCLAKIYRISLDGGATEVYSHDCGSQSPMGYFWGEDSLTGAIWKGHKVEGGIRIIESSDDGRTWTVKYSASYEEPPFVYEIAAYNDKVFAALTSPANAILYSGDGGGNWTEVLKGGQPMHGVSIFGEAVYAVTTGEEIWICPFYNQYWKWMRVHLPRAISLNNTTVFRQTKMLGAYIVTNAVAGTDTTTYWATADNFYTVSPIFRFGPTDKGANERYSGFGDTIYIGGTGFGDGMVWKAQIPDSLSVRIPCLRTILNMGSLAAGATSPLDYCWWFDSRLSPSFTINVTCEYNSLATQGIKIHVLSSADERNFDTVDTYTETHPFIAGQTVRKTYAFKGTGVIKVQIENPDSSQPVTAVRVIATLGQ